MARAGSMSNGSSLRQTRAAPARRGERTPDGGARRPARVGYGSQDMAAERSGRSLPPLLASRSRAAQAALVVGGPVVFGAVCGVALGLSEPVYLGLSLLAALGAVAAGFEHSRSGSGFLRGVVGGCLFGAALLAAHAIIGARPLAKLPDPPVMLVVFTTVIGAVLGALGAWLRGRRERAG